MSENVDPIIGQCKKCQRGIRESHPYVWCSGCGEPLSDELKSKLKISHESVQKFPWQMPAAPIEPISRDALRFLRVVGWSTAVLSVIGGIFVIANSPPSLYHATDVTGLRMIYLAIGCSLIVDGIVTGVFLNVVASIGNAVLDIWKAHTSTRIE